MYFPRPLTIAVKGPPPSTPPPSMGMLGRSSSNKSFHSNTNNKSNTNTNTPPLGLSNSNGNGSVSSNNMMVPYNNNNNNTSNYTNTSANSSHSNTKHNYEYDPAAAGGVVLKRAWQEGVDLQYEQKKGRNSRVRPSSKKKLEDNNTNDLHLNLTPIRKNPNPTSQPSIHVIQSSGRNTNRSTTTTNNNNGSGSDNYLQKEHQEKIKQQKSKRNLYNI